MVVEEIFPLQAGLEETVDFIRCSQEFTDGWISFYWGRTIDECEQQGDLPGAITAGWLRQFRDMAPRMLAAEATPE